MDLFGVPLTSFDVEEHYTNETLGDALDQDYACRHLARIAHLYFARTGKLSVPDLEDHIPRLLVKLFGPLPCDNEKWGWFGKSTFESPGPGNWLDETKRNLASTFDPKGKRWSKDQLGAFRVVQLMHPSEKGNLLDTLVFKPQGQVCYQVPLSELPAICEQALARKDTSWELVELLLRSPVRAAPGHFSADLGQYVVFRFVSWFVGVKRNAASPAPNAEGLPPLRLRPGCLLPELFAVLPCMELLFAWTQRLTAEQGPPAVMFRACMAGLWLTHTQPPMRLLLAVHVAFCALHLDPLLASPPMSAAEAALRFGSQPRGATPHLLALRLPLFRFLQQLFAQPCLAHAADLWIALLSPWRARTRAMPPTAAGSATLLLLGGREPAPGGPPEFAPEWAWFVVQHYFFYSELLNVLLDRLHREPNSGADTLEVSRRDKGAADTSAQAVSRALTVIFSDKVVEVLRFCDACLRDLDTPSPPCSLTRPAVVLALQRHKLELAKPPTRLFANPDDATNVRQQVLAARKDGRSLRLALQQVGGGGVRFKGIERLDGLYALRPSAEDDENDFKGAWTGPAVELVQLGLPDFVKKTAPFAFKRLTFLGSRQLEMGECLGQPELAAQYMGDEFTDPPPPCSFEVPWLVFAAIAVSRLVGINLRPVADVRNWLFVLGLVALLDAATGTRVAKLILGPWVVLLLGCAHFTGPAVVVWGGLIAAGWVRMVAS